MSGLAERQAGRLRLDRHLDAGAMAAALRDDVRAGLAARPKELPPKWFYDATGSELFERITELPEYYPTRREREILQARAGGIAALVPADTLVELGSGTSEKTRLLLDALRDAGTLRRFVPFDVDETTLVRAGQMIVERYPGVAVHAVVGDFERHLSLLPGGGRRLTAFLGGTVGNLRRPERRALFATLRAGMSAGDGLLLGTDLVKDHGRLVSAYDDAAGVTAAFNRNVLAVINRELAANFDLSAFAHVARWNAAEERIEMWLRSSRAQQVRIGALNLDVAFAAGEEMRTETSAKFRREGITAELATAGLAVAGWWTDAAGEFALSLSVPG